MCIRYIIFYHNVLSGWSFLWPSNINNVIGSSVQWYDQGKSAWGLRLLIFNDGTVLRTIASRTKVNIHSDNDYNYLCIRILHVIIFITVAQHYIDIENIFFLNFDG